MWRKKPTCLLTEGLLETQRCYKNLWLLRIVLVCLQVLHLRLRVHISSEAPSFSTSEQKELLFIIYWQSWVFFLCVCGFCCSSLQAPLAAASASRTNLAGFVVLWPKWVGAVSVFPEVVEILRLTAQSWRLKETRPGGPNLRWGEMAFVYIKKNTHKLLTSDMFAVKWLICLKWCCLTSFSSTFHNS